MEETWGSSYQALVEASFDARIYDDFEEYTTYRLMEEHWGDITAETMQRILEETTELSVRGLTPLEIWMVRIYAICVLGRLAPPGVQDILWPYVASADRQERWVATLALGRRRDARVFDTLQELLLEGLKEDLPSYHRTQEEEEVGVKQKYIDVYMVRNTQKMRYEWFLEKRCAIAEILAAWGDPHAVPALRRALRACWEIEQGPGCQADGKWGPLRNQWWHTYEDCLAYTLGQFDAWGALLDLGLPRDHLHIAIIYQILGSLHITSTFGVTDPVRKDQCLPAEFDPSRDLLSRPSAYELFEHPEIVINLLETRFGFSEEEQPWPIGQLQRIYQARFNEE